MKDTCLILPVGITRETVEGLLKREELRNVSCIITVLIEDRENEELMKVKKEILNVLRMLAGFMGAKFYTIWTSFGDEKLSKEIFDVLLIHKPRLIILGAFTGSRYVLLPSILSILWYQKIYGGCDVKIIHGVEGNGWSIEPLRGYFTTDLTKAQLRIFKLIYSMKKEEIRTKEDLMSQYNLGRSVYKILRALKEKGLIEWRRNRIRKTFPGKLLFNILISLEEEGDIVGS